MVMQFGELTRSQWPVIKPLWGGLVSSDTQAVFLGNITINLNRKRTAGSLRKCAKYCYS